MKALERQIADLQVKADLEAKMPPQKKPLSPSEVARQKRLKELQTEHGNDRSRDRERAGRYRVLQEDSSNDYEGKIASVPSRETDLTALMRDYETLKKSYKDLLARQQESNIAANLERRQIGEQLRIVDPASFPERPSNQQGATGGPAWWREFGGLLLGVLMVGFLEYRDSSFKTEDDVARVLAIPGSCAHPSDGCGRAAGQPERKVAAAVGCTERSCIKPFTVFESCRSS